jgi:hypothetical protein
LSAFDGSSANGTWSLYVTDDCGGDAGQVAQGWDLTVGGGVTAVTVRSFAARRSAKGVLVSWRTAAEARLLGFNLYRGTVKLNERLIAAKRKPSSYSFLDKTAKKGTLPTYRLQVVGLDGKKSWRGTVKVTKAKAGTAFDIVRVTRSFLAEQPLTTVCALNKNGSLRQVGALSDCRKLESGYTIAAATPLAVCYQADGWVRKVANAAACPAPGTFLSLPPQNVDQHFCADADGRLRRVNASTDCTGAESQWVSAATNHAPTDIGLSPSSIAEDQPSGTTVGTLSSTDVDLPTDSHTYTLVAGAGSTDNASFTITGSSLKTAIALNFEAKSSYSIRVRTTDSGGLFFEKQLTITVTNVNETPTDIALSSTTIAEDQPSGSLVGTFSTTDPDGAGTFTYTFAAGGTDNASFTITNGNELHTAVALDFETKSSYSIKVRSTDAGSLFFEKTFTITVSNVNEPPVNTKPGAQAVNEDTDLTFTAGTLISVADPDAGANPVKVSLDVLHGTLTLSGVAGLTFVDGTANGTGSVHFTGTIASINTALNGLKYKGIANYNSTRFTATPETLTIVSNDQGNTGSGGAKSDIDTVAITVNAVNDAPVAAAKNFNVGTNLTVNLSGLFGGASDPDDGDNNGAFVTTYTLASVTAGGATPCTGCTISNLNGAAGSVDVDPPADTTGALTLNYTLSDGTATSAAQTITLTISGPTVWFVDNATGLDTNKGTMGSPFKTLTKVSTVDATGDGIFLYSGTYAAGITLKASEKLVGQPTTGTTFDSVFGLTPPAGTLARPALATGSVTVQNTVTLASSVLVRGLALSTSTNIGLSGAGGLTGVDVAQTSITTTTGTTLLLNNVAGTVTLTDLDKNGSGTGISLTTVGAAVTVPAGATIAGTDTAAVDIDVGTGAFSYAGTISNSVGRTVEVTNRNAGSPGVVQFTGSVSSTGGTGVNLDNNDNGTVSFTGGLVLSTGANPAFAATNGGTVNVTGSTNTLTTTTGTPLNVNATTVGGSGLTFQTVTTNGAANGILLDTIGAGNVTVNGGTIAGATTRGVDINSGTGNFTYAGTITTSATGRSIEVTSHTAGTVAFSGAITDSGLGINLTSNTGATINFTGGVTASTTGANIPFNATGGGTVSVTGSNNTLVATNSVALNVTSTNIGASDLNFKSISAGNNDAGADPANGIVLNTTGSAGGLTVTGTSTTDGTGGTIQNTTTRAVSSISGAQLNLSNMTFTNGATVDFPGAPSGLSLGGSINDNAVIHLQTTDGVTLTNVDITGSAEQGINIHDVKDFSLINSTILNAGNAADEDGIHAYRLSGTNAITNTSVTSSGDDNVNIQNNTNLGTVFTNTSTINVTGGSFNTGVLGSGLLFGIRGAHNTTLNISGPTINNNFSGGVVADTFDTATSDIEVTGATITNNNDAIAISGNNGTTDFDIHDNPNITNQDFVNISITKAACPAMSGCVVVPSSTLEGRIRNNPNIDVENGHNGDAVSINNAGGGTLSVLMTNNDIDYAGTQRAVNVQGGTDGAAQTHFTATGNNIDVLLDGTGNAVNAFLGNSQVADPSGAGSFLCFDVGGAGALSNTITHSLGGTMAGGDIRVRQRFSANVRLPGYVGGAQDTTAVANYLDGRNAEVTPSTATFQTGSFQGGAACTQPSP